MRGLFLLACKNTTQNIVVILQYITWYATFIRFEGQNVKNVQESSFFRIQSIVKWEENTADITSYRFFIPN